ncbi:MAG TPA: GtrA family protein [Nocardioidaceae bacterium]|jgi:putative flippase GtrA
MPHQPPSNVKHDAHGRWHEFGGKILRYTTGSVVAAICSEVTFVVVYGGLDASPAWATCIGWLAGAIPNFWLNRSWTWRVRGRPHLLREVLPYVVIIVVTLVTAVVVTAAVDNWLKGKDLGPGVQTFLVSLAFLGVYGAMFLLRFFLLDKLFGRAHLKGADAATELTPVRR